MGVFPLRRRPWSEGRTHGQPANRRSSSPCAWRPRRRGTLLTNKEVPMKEKTDLAQILLHKLGADDRDEGGRGGVGHRLGHHGLARACVCVCVCGCEGGVERKEGRLPTARGGSPTLRHAALHSPLTRHDTHGFVHLPSFWLCHSKAKQSKQGSRVTAHARTRWAVHQHAPRGVDADLLVELEVRQGQLHRL